MIPAAQRPAFARLATMPRERFDAFLKAIESAKPSISLRDFALRVAETLRDDSTQIYELVAMIAGAYTAFERGGNAISEFVDEVCESEKGIESESLNQIQDWGTARERLRLVLSLPDTMGLTAKALSVVGESERAFCTARIVSDLRPIFRSDDISRVSASVVLHSLRIAFHRWPSNEIDNFFATLVTEDLHNLKDVIERAIAKDATLRSVASNSDMPLLEFRSEED